MQHMADENHRRVELSSGVFPANLYNKEIKVASRYKAFSSPEPLGLICNEPVALDATENTNFFIGWREFFVRSKLKYNLLRITFYFLSPRTANVESVSGVVSN